MIINQKIINHQSEDLYLLFREYFLQILITSLFAPKWQTLSLELIEMEGRLRLGYG